MAREAHFPTGFTEPVIISPRDLGPQHFLGLKPLDKAGLDIYVGVAESDVPDLTEIADQFGTREYCLNDIMTRWTDVDATRKQLAKDTGRGTVTLRSREDGKIMGLGWTGQSSDEERQFLPMCNITFAERLHEGLRGQHLGRPFAVAIVAVSMAVYNARKIGLETWGSNRSAVKSYLGAHAVVVDTMPSERPTQITDRDGVFMKDYKGKPTPHVNDVRLYMQYPWSK